MQLSNLPALWPHLDEAEKPSVLRQSLWNLTLCWLNNQVQAELRLKPVAHCMGVSVQTLELEVSNRASFLTLPADRRNDRYREILCNLLLK